MDILGTKFNSLELPKKVGLLMDLVSSLLLVVLPVEILEDLLTLVNISLKDN